MVTMLPNPPPADSDTAKPAGAVAVILPVKLLPETINCWIKGLLEAKPVQPEMLPVAVLAVIDCAVALGNEAKTAPIKLTKSKSFFT